MQQAITIGRPQNAATTRMAHKAGSVRYQSSWGNELGQDNHTLICHHQDGDRNRVITPLNEFVQNLYSIKKHINHGPFSSFAPMNVWVEVAITLL